MLALLSAESNANKIVSLFDVTLGRLTILFYFLMLIGKLKIVNYRNIFV
jgi:hypothetical protein